MNTPHCCYTSTNPVSLSREKRGPFNCFRLILVSLMVAFVVHPELANAAAVGATPGSFRVSESGAATYTIPIVVPPGTAGMAAPNLSLTYSSQGGNGIFGIGWSLSGLSSIYRCPASIAQDGFKGGINFNGNDRFCLDGQRLVAVIGVYGANGTEYRTETESYSRIISYGTAGNGPAWFKVWTKAGQIAEYGNTTDSRIEAQGRADVRQWGVNKVSDTKGNYVAVSYIENNANGEAYVSRIDYTGNASAGLAPYASVQFSYAARSDISVGYEAGSVIKIAKRITNIKTYSTATLAKDYRFTYAQSPSTQNSRVSTITECAGDGTCLPATAMEWQGGDHSYQSASNFNIKDARLGNSNGITGSLLGDFNGDGKTDILRWYEDYTYNVLYLSNGNGSFTPAATFNLKDAFLGHHVGHVGSLLGDFNGDGKTDILRWYEDYTYNVLYLSNGNGSFTQAATFNLKDARLGHSSGYVGSWWPISTGTARLTFCGGWTTPTPPTRCICPTVTGPLRQQPPSTSRTPS